VIDYGSQGRGEQRPDSDYDIEIYVHRDGWLYLFGEYADRLNDLDDEVFQWHRFVKQHFAGFRELATDLETLSQQIIDQVTTEPVYVTNVFDTRLVLFNMVHETWPLFSLAHGNPVWGSETHQSLLAFLRAVRPFHGRFFEVHLTQCQMAREQAISMDSSTIEGRCSWISSIMAYLRNSLSLLALIADGWFIHHRTEVIEFAEHQFPEDYSLMEKIYASKCDRDAYRRLLENWKINGMYLPDIDSVHRACIGFGEKILARIREIMASDPVVNLPESEWIDANRRSFERFPFCRILLDTVPAA
jgi:hypothetical protein